MKQATGSNTPQSINKVSIQLTLDGHSFSAPALSGEFPGDGPVEVELLTPRTTLVPEEFFDEACAGELLAAAGMVTMGAFLPLQGWMMALDGILIGARDFRYLAITCTLTATVYIALTAICVDAAAPMLPGDLAPTVLLWAMFNIVLMGGRGLFNGLRIRSESWLGQTAL